MQMDLWTLPYEDLSDLLRRYPGMYPLDYGTMGAPMLFRPWRLEPVGAARGRGRDSAEPAL